MRGASVCTSVATRTVHRYISVETVRAPGSNPKRGEGKRLASEALRDLVAEVEAERASAIVSTASFDTNETLGGLLDRFLKHAKSLGRSPTTLREYHRLADTILRPELGDMELTKLTALDLDRLYRELTDSGLKATSVRRVHALIGAALRQGEKWDLVTRNVARQASPPPVHAAEIVSPAPEDVRRVIEVAQRIEPMLASLLLIAALTGARRGELCALRWSDLDWQSRTLRIARSIYEMPGGGWGEKPTKTHAAQRIGLDELGLEVLRRHRTSVDALSLELDLTVAADAFIFSRSPVGSEPLRPDFVTKFAVRVAEQAGVDTHLHALRHFAATQAIAAGFDAVTVGARLGHADPSITLRVYSHAVEQRDRELAASLGRTLALPKSH